MSPSELRFEPTVLDAFKFLSSQFGFSCHESTPTSVLYTSANVEVEITLDPRSYEIDVEVKRIAENRSFPLHRIIEMSSPPEAKRWSLIQTSTPDRVEEFVPKLAGLLQEYGKTALSGDAKIFAKLADLEESEAMRRTRDLQIRQARGLAQKEWQSQNYAKVVSILSPIQEELTDSEFARFVYAKKRLESQQNRGRNRGQI
jgi:hypothetical protein